MDRSADAVSLIGREAEWEVLAESLAVVRGGGSRSVFIEGEAGIGKTRLIEELLAEASTDRFTILSGRAEELEHARPFGAIADALRRFGEGLPTTGRALDRLLRPQGGTSGGAPAGDLVLVDAFVDLVEELSLSRPTCVVLEDLHWADAATISAIRAVARRIAYLPILVVGTYRPHPRSKDLSRLLDVASREEGIELRLRPLDEADVVALVECLVSAAVGPRLRGLIASARGNPLYVTEVARALSQDGDLRVNDGVAEVPTVQLPPTLRLTILRRISFLPMETLAMLRHAAVLGSSFPVDELVAVTGSPVGGVLEAIRPAIEAKIVEERPGGLAFRHDLIQEAIYQDVPGPIRASMHNDAARALRAAGVALVRVAEHFLRALDLGVPELFDEAFGLANEVRFGTPQIAASLYSKALELPGITDERRDLARQQLIYPLITIGRVAEAEEIAERSMRSIQDASIRAFTLWPVLEAKMRAGRASDCIEPLKAMGEDPQVADWHRHVLRMLLVVAYCRTSNGAKARPLAMEVHAWARELERDRGRMSFTPSPLDRGVTAGTGVGLAIVKLHDGLIAEGLALAEEVVEIDEENRTPIPVVNTVLALALMEADRFAEAQEVLGRGRQREAEIGDASAVSAYGSLGSFLSFLTGGWDHAAAEARAALDLVADGSGSTDLMFAAHVSLSQILARRGSVRDAEHLIADMDRFIEERGPQWGMFAIAWTKALTLHASGATGEAFPVLRTSWDASSSVRYFNTRHAFADLLRLALEHGDRARAEEIASEVEEGQRRAEDVPSAIGASLQCRGLVEEDVDMLVAAVEAYRRSPRILERSRACEDAAAVLLRRDKGRDARAMFEEALSFYESMGAGYDARRVTAAMRQAGLRRGSRAKRDRPKTGWDALTEAERQVARLTVQGLTNPQIADRLYISKHTVQTHLSHVFAKVGVSSRVALAGIAAEKIEPRTPS